MNIIVHLLIANSVRKAVYEQTGVRLSFTGFMYGNILPDLSPKQGKILHYLKDSLGFVIESSTKLSDSSNDSCVGSFTCSKKAGVITHYLSDYFCYAHSEQYQNNIYRHHLYEFLMLFLFRRGLLFFRKQNLRQNMYFFNLESFILKSTEEYISGMHLKSHDIYYALKVSTAANVFLLGKTAYEEGIRIFTDIKMQSNEMYY